MATKNFVVKNGLTTGNIVLNAATSGISANVVVANLQVPSSANLGSVGNIIITGGSANYVLSTDGTGNLSWVAPSSGSSGTQEVLPNVSVNKFTGDGTTDTFTLSVTPTSVDYVFVNVDGVFQFRDSFTLNGTSITFGSIPLTGSIIEVSVMVTGTTGTGGSSSAAFAWSVVTANTTATANHGYFVDTTTSLLEITLPASASTGDTVKVDDVASNFGTNTCRVKGNGNKIQGQNVDLLLDYADASATLVFSNSTYGWRLVNS